jgi:hypothetical protein
MRPTLKKLRDIVQTIAIRKNDIGNENIGSKCLKLLCLLSDASGCDNHMPFAAQCFRNDRADGFIVVDQQDAPHCHAF